MIEDEARLQAMGEIRDALNGVTEGISTLTNAYVEAVDHDELTRKVDEAEHRQKRRMLQVALVVIVVLAFVSVLGVSNRILVGRVDCNVRHANQDVLDRLERQGYLSHDAHRIDEGCPR